MKQINKPEAKKEVNPLVVECEKPLANYGVLRFTQASMPFQIDQAIDCLYFCTNSKSCLLEM